jgi:hypothetical protein
MYVFPNGSREAGTEELATRSLGNCDPRRQGILLHVIPSRDSQRKWMPPQWTRSLANTFVKVHKADRPEISFNPEDLEEAAKRVNAHGRAPRLASPRPAHSARGQGAVPAGLPGAVSCYRDARADECPVASYASGELTLKAW